MALFGSRLVVHGETGRREAGVARAQNDEGGDGGRGKIDLQNILTLIPAEVVPLYIAGRGIEQASAWLVFGVCLAISVVLRAQASRGAGGTAPINWGLVAVSAFAFVLWANAVAEPVVDWQPKEVWGFIAMAFGIAAPKLVKADA